MLLLKRDLCFSPASVCLLLVTGNNTGKYSFPLNTLFARAKQGKDNTINYGSNTEILTFDLFVFFICAFVTGDKKQHGQVNTPKQHSIS